MEKKASRDQEPRIFCWRTAPMWEHRNRDKELLGVAEGKVKHRGPIERLSGTLEGIDKRS